jgi:NADPH:quinone reductase-like Zn-dependent oxidoreductase
VRAVVLRGFGGPEVLNVEDWPDPTPGPGEVLVRVHAVSINRSFDLLVRQDGRDYGPVLPLIPGVDPSGVIEEVGPGVDSRWPGERVTVRPNVPCGECDACRAGEGANCSRRRMIGVQRAGGAAELLAIPAENTVAVPEGVSCAEATVVGRHFPTAYSLAYRAELRAGETVLVMGAAGALGSCAVQVAKQLGATVIAAAGTDERAAAALPLGADYAVNYRDSDLEREVLRLTDGRGVDVVFENIGDPTLWSGAFNSLARGGRLVTVGSHGGDSVPLDVRRLYNRRLHVMSGLGAERREDLARSLDLVARGVFRILIDCTLPLSQAAEAHRRVEEGRALGKVILDPSLPD